MGSDADSRRPVLRTVMVSGSILLNPNLPRDFVFWSGGDTSTALSGLTMHGKKTRQTQEEVGRQHQGMDRPGVRQVPKGSGEQGKMEQTGFRIICVAPTTLAVKGLMMMMMIS